PPNHPASYPPLTRSVRPNGGYSARSLAAHGFDRTRRRGRAPRVRQGAAQDFLRWLPNSLSKRAHPRRRFRRSRFEARCFRAIETNRRETAARPRANRLLRLLSLGSLPQRAAGLPCSARNGIHALEADERSNQYGHRLDREELPRRKRSTVTQA